jgi:hypothetical protein
LTSPDYKAFALKIIGDPDEWGGDRDGGAIQDLAVKHGILKEVKYDPEIHGPNDVGAEPGDPWYVFAQS